MRRFLLHLSWFLLAPCVVMLVGEEVLRTSGEVWSMARVHAYQRAHPNALFLSGLDQRFYAYKYRGILEKRPSVIVAGSSRTMKFRAPMFGQMAGAFYNAGGIVNSLRDVRDFSVALAPSHIPKVLLLGVDLWWLNEQVKPVFSFNDEIAKGAGFSFDQHVAGLRWLFVHPRSVAREALWAVDGSKDAAIGIAARENGGGFRADGSFKSALRTPTTSEEWTFVDREVPPIIERVTQATGNFPPAGHVSADRLALLDAVLADLHAKGVLVIGYLPPFSSAVLAQLESDPRQRFFWSDFHSAVDALFRNHAYPLFDASDTAAVGMDDRAMSDGFHAEETFQARVMKALLRDDRVRAILPGADAALDRALASPNTNYWEVDFGR